VNPREAKRKAIRMRYRVAVQSGLWSYSDRYDAYYVTKTRRWVEPKCKDVTCEFCAKRPAFAPVKKQVKNPRKGSA
jgi:hypothetical protein